MESTEESLKQFEILDEDNIPPWAFAFFGKLKSEICAEVHAKVAYTMRIMLDKLREDLKSSSKSLDDQSLPHEECFCKDINKCNEKIASLFSSQYAVMKKEKKQMKRVNQEFKKCNKIRKNCVSESDTDNEISVDEVNFTVDNLPTLMPQYDPTKIPPIPPRKTSPRKIVTEASSSKIDTLAESVFVSSSHFLVNKEQKLLNGPPASEEMPTLQDQAEKACRADSTSSPTPAIKENLLPDNNELQKKETLSPSDSEFEVISMPLNVNSVSEYARLPDEASSLISDYEDSSSNDDGETETELEFKDCKPLSETAASPQPSGSLYPELELKKMSLSMISSTTSTLLDGYLSSCSNEGAVALDPVAEASVQIERQRAPYSVPLEDVEKINRQEIVHSQPLPSEFLRARKPYSLVPTDEGQQEQPRAMTQQQPQQTQHIPKSTRPKENQRDSTYRVDNLPESLWDEALTVAAQTYNAAKTAVENLADTFVPGVDKVVTGVRPSSKVDTPRSTSSTSSAGSIPQANSSPVRTQPIGMTQNEQKLFEMGFLDHNLNATLLRRHNGDMDRVIAELIEP